MIFCRPCLRRFVVRVPLLLALGVVAVSVSPSLAQTKGRAKTPGVSNPAPFGFSSDRDDEFSDSVPIGGPVIKSHAATTPESSNGNMPPLEAPYVPGVTYANASDLQSADPSQPPAALGPAQVPLDAIRALQVGPQPLRAAPMRVGNLDVLAPLVDVMPLLGATVTLADLKNVPGDPNSPTGTQYFQINRPGQSPIVLSMGQSKAWIDKNEQILRAAPLLVDRQIYLPIFSIAPLLGASTRLSGGGTLVITPTVESVQVFAVRDGIIAVTVKVSKPLTSAPTLRSMRADDGSSRMYVDFPGYSMGFDALSTTNERVVSSGAGDVLRARAGMPFKFPDTTRITLDLKRNLSGQIIATNDPTLFAFVVSLPNVNVPQPQPPFIPNPSPDPIPGPASDVQRPLRGLTVVLDAGHGGHDTGARGTRSNEKDRALDITQRVAANLRARGANVLMTRSGDYFITLQGRVDFANTRKADVFISIHNNASVNKASRGTETFYYTAQSVGLAREIHKEFRTATGLLDRGVSQARFYVIRKTWMPSVLLVVAFVTNPQEEGFLNSSQWCQRVADGVTRGVLNYNTVYRRGGLSG